MSHTKLYVVGLILSIAACGTGATDGSQTTGVGGGNTSTTGGTATNPNSNEPPAPIPVCTSTSALKPDVNVVVTTASGPNGFASPIAISNNLWSMGVDDQVRSDYVPTLNSQFVAYLKALHPGMLRFPAGINGQYYTWNTDPSASGQYVMNSTLVDQFMALCKAVGAQPFMSVNIETGSLSDATNLLTYTNVTKKYGEVYWEIGNEPDEHDNWPSETTSNYASKFLQYAQAMRAIDPTIKTVGGEYYSGESILGEHDQPDFFNPVMSVVGNQMNVLDWHYYPLYSSANSATSGSSSTPTTAHLLQEDASDWPPAGLDFSDTVMPYLRNKLSAYNDAQAQVWIDEFAEDPGQAAGQGLSDRVVGALWAADAMGRYADQGTAAIFHFIFKSAPQNYYTLLDANNNPRPEYYTYWLLANQFGDHMVKAPSDARDAVASHAATLAADGSLHVLLVNKLGKAQNVHLNLADYKPRTASQYNLVGSSLTATSMTLNGATLTPTNIGQGATAIAAAHAEACTDNTFSVPAYSVSMIVFQNK